MIAARALPLLKEFVLQMTGKALLFGDVPNAVRIMSTSDPDAHQKIGREIKNFDRTKWQNACIDIVTRASVLKYSADPELLQRLLATGNRTFVEASPKDLVWGIGMAVGDDGITDRTKWKGKNFLGICLGNAREILRKQFPNGAPTAATATAATAAATAPQSAEDAFTATLQKSVLGRMEFVASELMTRFPPRYGTPHKVWIWEKVVQPNAGGWKASPNIYFSRYEPTGMLANIPHSQLVRSCGLTHVRACS